MTPELERLLKELDQLIQTPSGPEFERHKALYDQRVLEIAERLKLRPETLH